MRFRFSLRLNVLSKSLDKPVAAKQTTACRRLPRFGHLCRFFSDSLLATFRRKKEKLRGGWVQSANFASECARKLLIL